VFSDASGASPRHEVITDHLTLHATGALAFTDWLSIGLELPVFLVNDGQASGFVPIDPVPGSALGDVRLSARIGIVHRAPDRDGLGLALELPVGLPTGHPDAFVSDGWTLSPTLGVDLRVGRARVAANLGVRLRDTTTLAFGTEVGHELLMRLAASVELLPARLTFFGELQGASHDLSNANNNSLEALLGGRLELGLGGLHLTLAGGRGLAHGYGSTAAKVVAQLGFTPSAPPPARDGDGDGLADDVDRCPSNPEDPDGFEDDDGCPDLDHDSDGVLDAEDRCSTENEDVDGFEDHDGCPDPDNDGDGVPDALDGPDGACMNTPEDKDDHQDADGCPEPDNDGDGILDVDDDCPLDGANRCGVKVDPCEITIADTVHFEYDRAVIKAESLAILDAVASLLAARDVIKQVEVQGHTDNQGEAAYNLDLSQRRAAAVVAYLESRGVARGRLAPKGLGEAVPIAANATGEGRARNRRVQFIIIDPATSGCGR